LLPEPDYGLKKGVIPDFCFSRIKLLELAISELIGIIFGDIVTLNRQLQKKSASG